MLETFLTLGCIVFFILLAMALQERAIMYRNYPTSCDVTYLPEKENIYMLGPSNFSSPEFKKSRKIRLMELENMSKEQLKSEIYEGTDIYYESKYDNLEQMDKKQLIEIALEKEEKNLEKEILPSNYESDTFLDRINYRK
jgi:hypothetical protein